MSERTEPWRGFRIRSARRQPHERGADAQLNEIVDVISVGTTVDVAGARITLLSVERYDDGFDDRGRHVQEPNREISPVRTRETRKAVTGRREPRSKSEGADPDAG